MALYGIAGTLSVLIQGKQCTIREGNHFETGKAKVIPGC